jgi:hypothetical protein
MSNQPRCPKCGVHWQGKTCRCYNCGYCQAGEVPLEVRLRRKAVDLINKNPVVAKKVVDFLEITL